MGIVVFSSLTLISKIGLELYGLISQLIEGILILTITRAYLVLQVTQLQVHLSSRLESDLVSWITAKSWLFASEGILSELCLSLPEVLLFLRRLWAFLGACQLLLLPHQECLRLWMLLIAGCLVLLIAEGLARFGCYSDWVDVGVALGALVPDLIVGSWSQFRWALLVDFVAAGLVTAIWMITVVFLIETLRKIGQLVGDRPWCYINLWWNHFFNLYLFIF